MFAVLELTKQTLHLYGSYIFTHKDKIDKTSGNDQTQNIMKISKYISGHNIKIIFIIQYEEDRKEN